MSQNRKISMSVETEAWELREPFRITGETITSFSVLVLHLRTADAHGRGEAIGVSYLGDDLSGMKRQLEARRADIEAGRGRDAQWRMQPGGARNALDCALWELEAQAAAQPVWRLAELPPPRPLRTTFTLGADTPRAMADGARGWAASAQALKLKLTGEDADADRVRAVRAERPGAWMAVDANRGHTRASLERLLPVLVEADVQLIEQPFGRDRDADLEGLQSPIPIAADESIQNLADLISRGHRYQVVNIKLDKCGGLTEGIVMAKQAARMGLRAMVGTMGGTSLAMAPGFLLGQLCDVVDLDGPLLLRADRPDAASYQDGAIWCSPDVWGSGSALAMR